MSAISGSSQPDDGLEHSLEFCLIYDLCHLCYDRFKDHEFRPLKKTSRRRNDVRMLNIELRKALTRPADLDLLNDVVLEDEESDGDGKKIIAKLCDLLERLAYRSAPVQSEHYTLKHANLEVLMDHLEDSTVKFTDVISKTGYPSDLLSLPSNFDRTQAIKVVKQFNNFLDQIKGRMTDPCELVEAPVTKAKPLQHMENPAAPLSGSDGSQDDFISRDDGLESRYQSVRTSLRALFAELSTCSHREVYNLLVQLPVMEKLSSREIYEKDIPLELLISHCSDSSQWIETRVTCAE